MRLFCSWLKLSSWVACAFPHVCSIRQTMGSLFVSLIFPCLSHAFLHLFVALRTTQCVTPRVSGDCPLHYFPGRFQYMHYLVRHALRTLGRSSMRLPMSFPMGSYRVPGKVFDNLLWEAPYVSCMHVRLYALPVYRAFYYIRQREFFLGICVPCIFPVDSIAHCSCVNDVVSVMLSSKHWAV